LKIYPIIFAKQHQRSKVEKLTVQRKSTSTN